MRTTATLCFGLLFALAHAGCSETGSEAGDVATVPPTTPGKPGPGMPGPGMPGGGDFVIKAPAASAALYDDSQVVEFDLSFTDAEWAKLQQHIASGKKEFVHCGFAFQGMKFPDAACRPKGRPAGWVDEPKPQLAVVFNYWDVKGSFLGIQRINLEAVPYHPAPVRDRLGMWLMQKAGLHTARVNHARVLKNGQYLGLYMNLEHLDKPFLDYHFQDPTGNLYSDGHVLETNQAANDYQRLWDLNDPVRAEPLTGDHSAFFAGLESMLDIHTMLRLTAAEVVLPTSDNWSNGSANFYYYDDPLTKRFIMLPWDLDTFLDSYAPPTADLYSFWGIPGTQNPPNKMLQLVYQNPAWKKEFEDNLVELRDGPYSQLPAQVTAVCKQIRPHVESDPHAVATVADMEEDCQSIKDGIAARTAYIKKTLGR